INAFGLQHMADSWDILELHSGLPGPIPIYCEKPWWPCGNTVQAFGTCYNRGTVNYALWGLIESLCQFTPVEDREELVPWLENWLWTSQYSLSHGAYHIFSTIMTGSKNPYLYDEVTWVQVGFDFGDDDPLILVPWTDKVAFNYLQSRE